MYGIGPPARRFNATVEVHEMGLLIRLPKLPELVTPNVFRVSQNDTGKILKFVLGEILGMRVGGLPRLGIVLQQLETCWGSPPRK
jgi:hypothetical protein